MNHNVNIINDLKSNWIYKLTEWDRIIPRTEEGLEPTIFMSADHGFSK